MVAVWIAIAILRELLYCRLLNFSITLHMWLFAEANLGKAWLTASISEVHMQYKAFTTKEIVADIRLGIGLRGINVTLIGMSVVAISVLLLWSRYIIARTAVFTSPALLQG